jgi:hypothetical protein
MKFSDPKERFEDECIHQLCTYQYKLLEPLAVSINGKVIEAEI